MTTTTVSTRPGRSPSDTPGVEVTDGDDQVLMSESSAVEQTPAGEAAASPDSQVSLAELQALKADLENTRKRMMREQTRAVEHATSDLVEPSGSGDRSLQPGDRTR